MQVESMETGSALPPAPQLNNEPENDILKHEEMAIDTGSEPQDLSQQLSNNASMIEAAASMVNALSNGIGLQHYTCRQCSKVRVAIL